MRMRVIMTVGMPVPVRMAMPVVVVMTLTMLMAVIMTLRLAVAIGAAFRIERRGNGGQLAAEAGDHVLDHMIAADAQDAAHELGRQVAVAQMPGNLDQMGHVVCRNFHEVFVRAQNLDDPAIFQLQAVAMMQMHGMRLIEQEIQTLVSGHGCPPPVPVLPVEGNGVCRGA